MRIKCKDNHDKPFNKNVVILDGDFRKEPIVRKESRQEICRETLIHMNMEKLQCFKDKSKHEAEYYKTYQTCNDIKTFADWILQLRDGDMNSIENVEAYIDIPKDLLIQHYENLFLSLRAILAPSIKSHEQVNDFILSLIPRDEKEYFNSNTPCKSNEKL
ncbi:hypothetical protein CR513_26033, partial [Mucuna pruriens]